MLCPWWLVLLRAANKTTNKLYLLTTNKLFYIMGKRKILVATILTLAAQNPDGFTLNVKTMQPQKHGICVAREETQNSFNVDGLQKVVDYVLENDVECVGGWYDSVSGFTYFDATDVFTDKKEAVQAMQERKQLAIFDLDNMEEIRNNNI